MAIRLLTEAAPGRDRDADAPREHLVPHSLVVRESSASPGE